MQVISGLVVHKKVDLLVNYGHVTILLYHRFDQLAFMQAEVRLAVHVHIWSFFANDVFENYLDLDETLLIALLIVIMAQQ